MRSPLAFRPIGPFPRRMAEGTRPPRLRRPGPRRFPNMTALAALFLCRLITVGVSFPAQTIIQTRIPGFGIAV